MKFYCLLFFVLHPFFVHAQERDSLIADLVTANWQLVKMTDLSNGKTVDVSIANVYLKFTADGRSIASSNGRISEDVWELDTGNVRMFTNQTRDKANGLLELRIVRLDSRVFRVHAVYEGENILVLDYINIDKENSNE